jgi:hypothetical protein
MAIKLSTPVRNARLDAVETAIGLNAILRIYVGAPPALVTDADPALLLAELPLPANWMADAAGGIKDKASTWQDPSANASGTAGHFRLLDSTGTTCHMQGTCSGPGGGGDLVLDNPLLAISQAVTVSQFRWTDGNVGV